VGVVDDKLIFAATGPFGHELYRIQGDQVSLLADIVPNGSAFFLTFGGFDALPNGSLQFTVHSAPPYARQYFTDGTSVSPVPQFSAVGLPDEAILHVDIDLGDVKLVRAVLEGQTKLFDVVNGVATELFSRDVFGFFNSGLAPLGKVGDEWVFLDHSGPPAESIYYRVTVVPEPCAAAPLIACAIYLSQARNARGRRLFGRDVEAS
jgi:hypothetical protein